MQEEENMRPVVSVITICYNPGKSLIKTFESVLAQGYMNFEYIIQDGNSTDGTEKLISSYLERFHAKGISLHYFREKDSGIYDAMNRGVQHAHGVWINFMNAGDSFYSAGVLKEIFGEKDHASSAILYGDAVECEYNRYYMFRKAFDQIEARMPFSHQSVFARKELLLRFPFRTDLRIGADYDFLLTVWKKGFFFTDVNTIVCIVSKDGVSSVKLYDTYLETIAIRKSHGINQLDDEQLVKKLNELKLKQFVMDYFPGSAKKMIRSVQLTVRKQKAELTLPPWEKKQ